jgi:3-hydroxyisobutyrate dehydrogenase-like beta-hydroxyacid dehydrogenase
LQTIGFIGLGTMGKPMAENLIKKGYPVTVYNRTAEKAEELVASGANAAATPADAARAANVLITMLSNDSALEEVIFGVGGVMKGVHPGLTVIDCSTVAPKTSQKLYAELAQHGVDFLDAPVTGSKPAAVSGTLVFMVGGNKEVMERHEPVFAAMGSKLQHMGPSGSGSYTKLAHNTMVGIHALALCEGLSIAAKAGLDPEQFLQIVLAGAASSRQAELKGPKIVARDFSNQFSMRLMHKDLRLASQLTNELELTAPLLQLTKNIFEMGLSKQLGDHDLCAVAECYEEWMGTRIGSKSADAKTTAGPAADRRTSTRVAMDIQLQLSVYQWEQEGAFSGQNITGTLYDLSNSGLQIGSSFPLAMDMFVVIHFPQEAELPPITGKIIRIEDGGGEFRYGCMLSGVPPHVRIKLEQYIDKKKG